MATWLEHYLQCDKCLGFVTRFPSSPIFFFFCPLGLSISLNAGGLLGLKPGGESAEVGEEGVNCTMPSQNLRKFPGFGPPSNLASGQGSHNSHSPKPLSLNWDLSFCPMASLEVGDQGGLRSLSSSGSSSCLPVSVAEQHWSLLLPWSGKAGAGGGEARVCWGQSHWRSVNLQQSGC